MKNHSLLFFAILLLFISCSRKQDNASLFKEIEASLNCGNLGKVQKLTDSLKNAADRYSQVWMKADSLEQISERMRLDFPLSEPMIMKQLDSLYGSISKEDIEKWEKKGWLEWKMIDGEKKYFNSAATNLILIKAFHEDRDANLHSEWEKPELKARLHHTKKVYSESVKNQPSLEPVNMNVTYTLSVHPDVVPAGEIIKCWLPFPADGHSRQYGIELTNVSEKKYFIAPDTAIHTTIYMEKKAEKGKSTVFSISFKYTSEAEYIDLSKREILPYNKESPLYLRYTSEQLPQICFTDDIKKLADSITSPGDNPYETVRKVYTWFKHNIPWTEALEYSIMPNIPEYVLSHGRGDCGMQTLLYMSILRYKGIPVRWQSGWMVPPGDKSLHDWCEIYYEGIGWVPSDISYSLQNSNDPHIKYFYLSGIDSYRLIINKGIAGPLHPAKKFLRSEPYDFQRGEVEWSGGNLYFDKWDYDMKIEYAK